MPQGKIKRIVSERGFGFIATDSENDLFFHHSALQEVTIEELTEGTLVDFEIGRGPKGARAEAVRRA
ncbi:putative cold shock protein A [Planctomycetes bacterium Pan216]|uniref:Putative cold shock protein A n=1 Tax=Kolteria novifilia TaxID=2527975 RepID=A0A518B5M8_9BACT|nr:putative cold shock protein A [Planctomycetes bacterium Pan216]